MPRKVLVSYLERNKVFSLPDHADMEVSDVKYLRREFRSAFSFSSQNVNIEIVFQKYNRDWNFPVEIEEDSVICDMDKLSAVVMPILGEGKSKPQAASTNKEEDQESQASTTESNNSDLTTTSSNLQNHDPENAKLETESRKRDNESLDDLCDPEDMLPAAEVVITTSSKQPPAKRVKIKESSLPDPFPLPSNYRPDVQVALSSGKMTGVTKTAFYTQVAGAIFNHKRYPTGPEFIRVASEIVRQYPFLGSTRECGTKTGAIVETLIGRFKELRRERRERGQPGTSSLTVDKKPPPKKKPGMSVSHLMEPPPLPEGEDETSMLRHASILREHDKHKRANTQVVNSLMENLKTFPYRRAQALDSGTDLKTLLSQFPFMQTTEQLYLDMDRILKPIHDGTINHVTISESWRSIWVPRIFKQAKLESSNKKLKQVMESVHQESPTSALVLLPYLLKDSRAAPDFHKLIYPIPITADLSSEARKRAQNEPYLLCCGDVCQPEQIYLVIEREIVCEIKNEDTIYALLSAFYVFNIEYTLGCSNVYIFLEKALLGIEGKPTPTVAHFMSALAALK